MDHEIVNTAGNILSPALSFLGALGGVYLGSILQKKAWHMDFSANKEKSLFNERIKLIERASILFAKTDLTHTIAIYFSKLGSLTEEKISSCFNEDGTINTEQVEKIGGSDQQLDRAFRIRGQLDTLSAEFLSIAALSSVHFSDKIVTMFEPFSAKPWYSGDGSEYANILSAMRDELLQS